MYIQPAVFMEDAAPVKVAVVARYVVLSLMSPPDLSRYALLFVLSLQIETNGDPAVNEPLNQSWTPIALWLVTVTAVFVDCVSPEANCIPFVALVARFKPLSKVIA